MFVIIPAGIGLPIDAIDATGVRSDSDNSGPSPLTRWTGDQVLAVPVGTSVPIGTGRSMTAVGFVQVWHVPDVVAAIGSKRGRIGNDRRAV